MEKQRWEESEKRKEEGRRPEKKKSQKKEDAGARKGRNVAIHYDLWLRRVEKEAEPAGQMRDENLHAVVRSTFPTQNEQHTSCSEQFWKLRCRKSVRHSGAKHISKSKRTTHTMPGALGS